MEPTTKYLDVFQFRQGPGVVDEKRVAAAARALWKPAIDQLVEPGPRPSEKPISAKTWALMANLAYWANANDRWRWSPPPGGLELRLDGRYVRAVGTSPRGRHIHYQVLGEKRRRWMRVDQFLREATVAGHFKRAPSGELVWIEPKEPAHAPD